MSIPAGGRRHRLWPYAIALAVIVAALMSTVFLPFVNRATLWFGLPSVGVWSVVWVLAIVPALAALEFSGRYDDEDARDADGRDAEAGS
jgi:hypothetical protein